MKISFRIFFFLFLLLAGGIQSACGEKRKVHILQGYRSVFQETKLEIPKIETDIIAVPDNTTAEMYKSKEYLFIRDLIIDNCTQIDYHPNVWGGDIVHEVFYFVHGDKGKKMSPRIRMEILQLYLFLHPLGAREYRAIVAIKMNDRGLKLTGNEFYILPLLGIIQSGSAVPDYLFKTNSIEVPEGYEDYARNQLILLHMIPKKNFYEKLEENTTEFSYQNNKVNWESPGMLYFWKRKKN